MTSRKRYLFLAVASVLVAVALMHRLPRRWADPVDLAGIRQRIAALEHDVDAARSADPAGAYVPRVAGSIADPATRAVELLKQLPGVARVEVLVTGANPSRRIIHFRDYHFVPQELYAADLAGAGGPGRPLYRDELELRHRELELQTELVAIEQAGALRCLARHHGLKRVLCEGLTLDGLPQFSEAMGGAPLGKNAGKTDE
jgi:hypothetical protein